MEYQSHLALSASGTIIVQPGLLSWGGDADCPTPFYSAPLRLSSFFLASFRSCLCYLRDFHVEGDKLARGAYIRTNVCATHGSLVQRAFMG